MLTDVAVTNKGEPESALLPLRIGVVVAKGGGFENWQMRLFDRIMEDPRFDLARFVIQACPSTGKDASSLFSIVSSIERTVLAREPEYHARLFAPDTQHFEFLDVEEQGPSEEAGWAKLLIHDLALDLIINLTPEGLPREAVRQLPLGELTPLFSGVPAGTADWSSYASIIAKRPTSTLHLQVRCGSPCEPVNIASASFNVKDSAARNAGFLKERAVTLLMRELNQLAETRHWNSALQSIEPPDALHPPSSRELAQYSVDLSSNLLTRAGNALRKKLGSGSAVWTLFTGQGDIYDFDPRNAVEIIPDKDEIRADPFLLEHQGDCYLFYEAYAQGSRKAHIGVGRLNGNQLTKLGVALECDYHLSYPFVFHHEGELFMMPETNAAERLEIWRCVEFPLKWELYSTALEGLSPADSTLTFCKGRWWLFTNLSDFHAYKDHCSELHIFEVNGPSLSNIVAHKRNPVVIDSTLARNAGRLFERNGKLYRPSQRNINGVYGYGLNIMEIDQLDLHTYSERCVRTVTPGFKPGLIGCHHFDAAGGRYIVDARRERSTLN